MDLAASEESHVGMHTEIATDNRFHLSGPAESGRIDHTLDTTGARSGNVQLDAADFAMFGFPHGREQWIGGAHLDSLRTKHITSAGTDHQPLEIVPSTDLRRDSRRSGESLGPAESRRRHA